ncbi:MAG TPA: nucleoside monophosphate kinase [Candidatus Paceibacterota bacterium]|nr:nucleoside monophosphate kinase [Candidatus Paceibacterota bacterium]
MPTVKSPTVFFVGKPACGKSTQVKLLAEKTGWLVFASGHLFREIAEEDSPLGRKVKSENDAGLLQPYWFAMYLYLKSLFSIPEGQGAIFDGFNRKVPEAELIIDSLRWLDRSFSIVYLAISDEEVHRRVAERKQVSGRMDDHVISERLKEYYEYTEKAIGIFRDAGVLLEVNGEEPLDKIHADVYAVLGIKE